MKIWLITATVLQPFDDYGTYHSVIISEEKPILICPDGIYTYGVRELKPTQNPSYPQCQEYSITWAELLASCRRA